ncbi:MAG: chromate transporter [Acidimicrobiia bacterium]|nr:chromate transporter [Acidimicrobiia bacterium]MYF83794.1 chromate transporter [Acidimicrobiia bacterium]
MNTPTERPDGPAPLRLGIGAIGVIFFRMGLVAFGGLLLLLVLIERELVDRRPALTKRQITEAVTYTRLLPGSGGPLVVSYLGYVLRGVGGSGVATLMYLLPGILVMTGLAVGFVALSTLPLLAPAIEGLLAAVVGIQSVYLYRFARKAIVDAVTATILVAGLGATFLLGVSAPLIVLLAGVVGVFLFTKGLGSEVADAG